APVPKPAVVAAPAPPPPAVAPAVTPESKPAREPDDSAIQALRDLPEPIRRAIPAYSMDGYMYSPNPADRLVLIDKVLRREGEEVAPGLVLEKLLPKGAVFTFRGYRYRVAF
ncbi:general secretion pathway protein GspB, partial [Pseudoduganella buxea]